MAPTSRPARAAAAGLTAALSLFAPALAGAEPEAPAAEPRWQGLEHAQRTWSGDLDGMLARRQVRLLVVPSRTFYFVDRGTQRGIDYDLGQELQKELNQKRGRKQLAVEVVYVPVHRDDLLPALIQGRGDVAAANMTITPEREQWIDFASPLLGGEAEIVVTGPGAPELRTLDDLAGREVFVRLSSSYFQSLWRLNQEFGKRGLAPVKVKAAPEQLEDEDVLEMVSAGLVPSGIL